MWLFNIVAGSLQKIIIIITKKEKSIAAEWMWVFGMTCKFVLFHAEKNKRVEGRN